MGEFRIVTPAAVIRKALINKGTRYGDFAHPYVVVVVDCKGELTGGDRNAESLIDAAFGTVVTAVTNYGLGEHRIDDRRRDDGYFGHPMTRRHKNVSAVILLPKPHVWDLRNERWQPLLLRNPWAAYPLPDGLLPLPGYQYLVDKNEFAKVEGKRLADIIGLPDVWPPADADKG